MILYVTKVVWYTCCYSFTFITTNFKETFSPFRRVNMASYPALLQDIAYFSSAIALRALTSRPS